MEMEHLIKLIEAVSHSGLSRFEYEESGVKIHMEKPETVQVSSVQVQTEVSEQIQEAAEDQVITCPLVGIFYAAPEEGAEAFVSVGDSVKKGQTLAIVEAMKLMNEIESEYDGVVTEVLVQNGQAVEFGQPLFKIR
ncbi:MAG: biotin/lipoyl-binding protein [Lachnospiraceae bacterium]|mgnify:FL=1|jgi:Biotin carboxyl carrier protein|nr:biotin/lipoyl-binding protein [Lachnospiraceae bacterium]